MRNSFFGRYALWILVIIWFFVPFALRGARVAVSQMKNEVKDWLPASFEETAQMDWFWRHFSGERFVVVSWEGCTATDESFRLLQAKLRPEVPPSQHPDPPSDEEPESDSLGVNSTDSEVAAPVSSATLASESLERPPGFLGDRLGLFSSEEDFLNWGGRQEKWLRGAQDEWYFITPTGELYQWGVRDAPLASLLSRIWRALTGTVVQGELVADLGPLDGPWYYQQPRRLNAQFFKSVTTGPGALAALTGEGGVLQDDPAEAQRRLSGLLFGADEKQTCLLLTLTDNGTSDFHRVLGRGMLGRPRGRLLVLAEEAGISPEQLKLGGPPVDNLAIDEEGTITLVRLVTLSGILGFVLAFACFRTISATMIVFFVGGISAVMSLAIVRLCGSGVDAILMSMPALVYVLGISGAVHLINYYHDAVEEHGLQNAAGRALRHGWKPAVLCSTTTAMGLGSLYASDIIPIRKFGIFSAVGVMATLLVLFSYLPAALELWPQPPRKLRRNRTPSRFERNMDSFWDWFGGGIIRHHGAVAALCIFVIATLGFGVTRIQTSINLLKLFDPQAKILNDYAWLEQHLGRLVPMEVVVRFPATSLSPRLSTTDDEQPRSLAATSRQLTFLDRMDLVAQVEETVQREFGAQGRDVAGNSLSALTFAPVLPPVRGSTLAFARRGATNARLEAHRDEFLRSDFLRVDPTDQSELWRISLRIGALKNVDYGQFVGQLKQAIEPVLAAQRQRETILETIASRRSDHRFTGGSVCVLGVRASDFAEGTSGASESVESRDIDETGIFVRSLRHLLIAARLRVDCHDPSRPQSAEVLKRGLNDYDCVVLVRPHPIYETEDLRKSAVSWFDARNDLLPATQSESSSGDLATTGVRAIYTGVVPIVYKAQRTLLNSLIESTFWSFVTITPLMMILSRGVFAGIVAMLPNALPVFVIFGSMGWLGVHVDIGSMMTASIALGVAVDDTIHFLTWYREELVKQPDRQHAILAAYKRCATPTFQAALISGLGLSIFACSTFEPTQRFGYLMLTILLAGMVAELVFFPALLAGPMGVVFRGTGAKRLDERPRRSDNQPYKIEQDAVESISASVPLPTSHLTGTHRTARRSVR